MCDESAIRNAVAIARKNWLDWHDVYTHKRDALTNPLFSQPGRFGSFCKEYSVHRTIRSGMQADFRSELQHRIEEIVSDPSGRRVDQLETELRPRYGAHDPPRSVLSAISKVSAFVNPREFVAWDQYARKGLNVLIGRRKSEVFASYSDYLGGINQIWNQDLGHRIVDCAETCVSIGEDRYLVDFQRRVLDVCLMSLGEREMSVPPLK